MYLHMYPCSLMKISPNTMFIYNKMYNIQIKYSFLHFSNTYIHRQIKVIVKSKVQRKKQVLEICVEYFLIRVIDTKCNVSKIILFSSNEGCFLVLFEVRIIDSVFCSGMNISFLLNRLRICSLFGRLALILFSRTFLK